MVVKKNIRRSKNNKNKKQSANKENLHNHDQINDCKSQLPVSANESDIGIGKIGNGGFVEVFGNDDNVINYPLFGVDKLKAMLDKQTHLPIDPTQKLNRLPEGFHQTRVLAVTNIRCLHVFYDGAPDTFALSVGILDKFMATIRVKHQHISCVAAACYFIATKIHEEEEDLPSGNGLCKLHGNRWKLSDLCRMESVVLQKLSWRLPLTTYLTYINLFLEILQENYPGIRAKCSVDRIVEIAEKYLRFGYSQFFKPSSVGVCILYQYLLESQLLDSMMSAFIFKLQSICAITDSEMFELEEVVKAAELSIPEAVPKSQRITNTLFYKIRSRPSYDGETDLPTIEEDNTQEEY